MEEKGIVCEEAKLSFPQPDAPKRLDEITPSKVFLMFNEGYSPMEVVDETDGDPIKIRDWYRAWLDMRTDWTRVKNENLDREARRTFAELKELLGKDALKMQGRKPSGLIAAIYYILAREEDLIVSQAELAEYYRISEPCIRENIKLLQQLMKDKSPKLANWSLMKSSERGT